MLGLQRGTVRLYPHETAWEAEAECTIIILQKILGDDAKRNPTRRLNCRTYDLRKTDY